MDDEDRIERIQYSQENYYKNIKYIYISEFSTSLV